LSVEPYTNGRAVHKKYDCPCSPLRSCYSQWRSRPSSAPGWRYVNYDW